MAPLLVFSVSEELLHSYAQSLQVRDSQQVKLFLYSQQRPLDLDKLDARIGADVQQSDTDAEMLLLANGSSYLWFEEEHGPRTIELRAALRRHCRLSFVVCPTAREYAEFIRDLAAVVPGKLPNETTRLWEHFSHSARPPALPAGMEIVDIRGNGDVPHVANTQHAHRQAATCQGDDRGQLRAYTNGLAVLGLALAMTIVSRVSFLKLQAAVRDLAAEIQQLKASVGVIAAGFQQVEAAVGIGTAEIQQTKAAVGILATDFQQLKDAVTIGFTGVLQGIQDVAAALTKEIRWAKPLWSWVLGPGGLR